ncbi:hypothetical protein [Acinetobacter nosocomialis]|uniref:hypothetical protein n=1 Tax=Acinetobacter nosocomialis TaxID=106654 RepID=UPI0033B01EC7
MEPNELIGKRVAIRWEDLVDPYPQAWGRGFIAKMINRGPFFKSTVNKVSTHYIFNRFIKRKEPIYFVDHDFCTNRIKLLKTERAGFNFISESTIQRIELYGGIDKVRDFLELRCEGTMNFEFDLAMTELKAAVEEWDKFYG